MIQTGSVAAEIFFAALSTACDEAVDRCGLRRWTVSAGRWSVDLEFAGDGLPETILPALARVSQQPAPEVVSTIRIFDSASTGVEAPPAAWRPQAVRERGEVKGFNDERFQTVYHDFGAISMHDTATKTTVFWVESPESPHWWERAEPLRAGLHWALNGDGRYLAHAAAVGDDDGVVLLVGRGGAGKTTTTISCLRAGMSFVGDNYVLVSSEDSPVVHAVYANVKLRDGTFELMPDLIAKLGRREGSDEKLVVDVRRHWPTQLQSGLQVRAIAVVSIASSGPTRTVAASPVEALLALAPTTVYQLPRNGDVLRPMAELVRQVPVFRLELGPEPASSPDAIRDLLAHR